MIGRPISRFVPLLLVVSLALASPGWGQSFPLLSPQDAIAHGIAAGRLPPWLTWDDKVTLKQRGSQLYGCFTDATTGARWTVWGRMVSLKNLLDGNGWQFTKPFMTTDEDQRVCFPPS